MGKTKIDWCDWVFNPVWGCLQNPPCPYCYARKIARRFGKTEDEKAFKPHWKEKNFQRAMPKKPSMIFVNSMSDIAFWEGIWMTWVLEKIRQYPQHTFLFLTKKPQCYIALDFAAPVNAWFGTTITKNGFPLIPLSKDHVNFISIEPILEPINLRDRHIPEKPLDWLIVGPETGNRKDKVIPKLTWIENLVDFARRNNIPIWLKENLRGIWPEELIQEKPSAGGSL